MTSLHGNASPEAEARLLILIHAFTTQSHSLEGRTKLAKLDFLLRYPAFMARAMAHRAPTESLQVSEDDVSNVETRMIRYRYGPWDPAYFTLLGRLIGKGLVAPIPLKRGIGYRTTAVGTDAARALGTSEAWRETADRARLLKKYFNLSGTNLKQFIYDHFPEVTSAQWGDRL